MKNHFKKFFTVMILFYSLFIQIIQAATFTDMVLVPSLAPFYIDIFETTCGETKAAIGACDMQDLNWKPARITFKQAQEYCKSSGKRLPTYDEWLAAASHFGQNKNYSLRGDSLVDSSGKLLANIRGTASIAPEKFDQLGIDAVGTVGMTGNRYEWGILDVQSPNAPIQCGGQYETQLDSDVHLSNICRTDSKTFAANATVRCVVDDHSGIKVDLSSRIKGELKVYIEQLIQNPVFNLPTASPSGQIFVPLQAPAHSIKRNEYAIQENEYTRIKDYKDPKLREIPPPNADLEY